MVWGDMYISNLVRADRATISEGGGGSKSFVVTALDLLRVKDAF